MRADESRRERNARETPRQRNARHARQPVLVSWVRYRAVSITVVLLVVAFAWGQTRTYDVANQARDTAHGLVAERIESRTGECHSTNEFRANFPTTLEGIAKASASTTGIDLTALPQFKDVPDSVKAYLAALTVALRSNPRGGQDILTTAASEYRRKFPVQDCEALRKRLERQLLPH